MNEKNNNDTGQFAPLLVFEIGTEEIPARFIPDILAQIREKAERLFGEYRLCFGSVRTYGTPRRITLIAELEREQLAVEREAWGPPVKAAYDASGAPTRAAEAFAQSQGIAVSALVTREKGKGSYVVALVSESSGRTMDVLPELLEKLVTGLHVPKSMRWGDGTMRFVRPIHWFLALYDNQKIAFEIEGVKSKASTRGHRFLSPASFEVKESRSYINMLRTNFVVVDPAERKKLILDGAAKLAESVNAALVQDEELLEHVTNLVEYPVPVLASFSKEYLKLPKELLVTVMKDHQKYFALEDGRGNLANHFVVVSNTRSENSENVRKGAEKVIKARFEDARFYFEDDIRTPITERQEKLGQVVFHEKLGTVAAKAERFAALASSIAAKCHPDKKADAAAASLISKNDLVAGVVFEFPELQGIMAGYYAQAAGGYSHEIVQALREQYMPRFSGDSLPAGEVGALVSLADKLDTVASFFMIGLVPSSTEDPFALRRQAIGITLILIDRKYDITLPELFSMALVPYAAGNREEVISSLLRFFEQRFDQLFQGMGYSKDIIDAVSTFSKTLPLHLLCERMEALKRLKEEEHYETLLQMLKRVNNIAPKGDVAPVDAGRLVLGEERALLDAVESVSGNLGRAISENAPQEAIKYLITLGGPITAFFDKVLIMDKDEAVRQNRLSLIKSIQTLAFSIADFSKLS